MICALKFQPAQGFHPRPICTAKNYGDSGNCPLVIGYASSSNLLPGIRQSSATSRASILWSEDLPTSFCNGRRLALPGWTSGKTLTRGRQVLSSSVATEAVAAEASDTPAPDELVTRLLKTVEDSDAGAAAEASRKAEVERLIGQLEAVGMEEPLKSPLVFGEWEVVYTSSPTAAGGYYRGAIGRALLKTKELVQTISEPNRVGNRVTFDALNWIPGKVSLQGEFKALDNKWVEVDFVPPTIELGSLKFEYGKNSSVRLSVTYLDERIRVGRGSRGSIFVFKRM